LTLELTQEQELLRETARDFAQKEIAPMAPRMDAECKVPPDLLAKLSILGLLGVSVPSKFGGAGADYLSQLIVSEEVSRASGSLGFQVSFHNAVMCDTIVCSTNDHLKKSLLPKLVGGPCGAPDLLDIGNGVPQTTCKIEDNCLILNGASENVLSGSSASVFLVVAQIHDSDGSAAIAFSKDDLSLDSNDSFRVGEEKKLLGMRASATCSITFHNLKLPNSSLLYDLRGSKEQITYELMPRSWLATAAVALGIAQAAVDASVKYANQREQFDTKIGNFYAVQDMISTSETELQTARSLTYSAAQKLGTKSADPAQVARESASAKIAASNAAVASARRAIRVHGGYGFMRDYPVERFARDARLTPLYPETNERLKAFVAKSLLGINS
jgi:alkylation response protein AidB-like acyl-CoA dehydrogenase